LPYRTEEKLVGLEENGDSDGAEDGTLEIIVV
jgi:hypothetical protein